MFEFGKKISLGLLVVTLTILLMLLLFPFTGAILWAVIFAILFGDIYRRLTRRMNGRRNIAAVCIGALITGLFVIPAIVIGMMLLQQISNSSDEINAFSKDATTYLNSLVDAPPAWMTKTLGIFGLESIEDLLSSISQTLASAARSVAQWAVTFGTSAVNLFFAIFIMLYLNFFFLRDGKSIMHKVRTVIPLEKEHFATLTKRFVGVIRATVRGSMLVALAQGAAGGIVFAILGVPAPIFWAVLMTIAALIPAVGSGLIWLPVAIFMLVTGEVASGIILLLVGGLGISMIDNVLRPILVGKDAGLPDYIVLLTTLGGVGMFGFNGIVLGPMIAALCFASWELFASEGRQGQPVNGESEANEAERTGA